MGPGPTSRVAGVVLGVAVVAAVLLLVSGGAGVHTREDPTPDVPLPVDDQTRLEREGFTAVDAFAAAINADDGAAVRRSVGDRWLSFRIPGFDAERIPAGNERALAEGAASLALLTDLEPGVCLPREPHPGSTVEIVIVCPQARFFGPFVDVFAETDVPGAWFSVTDGKVVAFGRSAENSYIHPEFCTFTGGFEADIAAFDLSCRPRLGAAAARALSDAATKWLAEQRPSPPWEAVAARLSAQNVVHFLTLLDAGRLEAAAVLVHPDLVIHATPGSIDRIATVEWQAADFIRWMGTMYELEVDAGSCGLLSPGVVTCPAVEWNGPMLDALGTSSFTTDLVFRIADDGRIAGIDGDGPPGLPQAALDFCSWVSEARPAMAPFIFLADCEPIYTQWAGEAWALLAPIYVGES